MSLKYLILKKGAYGSRLHFAMVTCALGVFILK